MTRRVNATIHFNTDRYTGKKRKGAFDFAEFAKLMRDLDSFRESRAKDQEPHYYVIYSLDNPASGEELCLCFHEVEAVERDEESIS